MAAVRHRTARCMERKLTWAWLARHGMNAAIRLLGGRDCWMGGWAQHTGCSLRIVTERAAEVDPVHQLADDTIESSRDTLNMTCCTAGVRRWHTLILTRMVGRVTAGRAWVWQRVRASQADCAQASIRVILSHHRDGAKKWRTARPATAHLLLGWMRLPQTRGRREPCAADQHHHGRVRRHLRRPSRLRTENSLT